MKRLILYVITGIVFISCEKGKEENTGNKVSRYETGPNPAWAIEQFKKYYNIQFPQGYTGAMATFEGNTFDKRHIPDSSFFWYFYSNGGTYFNDFRDTLINTNLSQILVQFTSGSTPNPIWLTERIEFTRNGELAGIFYHDMGSFLHGRLFWKDNGFFKQALEVMCRSRNLPQAIEIIRTIAPR